MLKTLRVAQVARKRVSKSFATMHAPSSPSVTPRPVLHPQARAFSNYLVTPRDFTQEYFSSIPYLSGKPEDTSRIIPVCAGWYMLNDEQKRSGLQSYKLAHIPLARFFDIDFVKDDNSPYPHMLPSAEKFAAAVGEMGIRNQDTVVVYDTAELGIFSAPRVAWTFKAFGHEKVHVLNNFREYVQQGFPVVSGLPQIHAKEAPRQNYTKPKGAFPQGVADFEYMRRLAKGEIPTAVGLDARSEYRYKGTAPEPRPGLSSGHMPNSISLQFPDLLDPETKAFLPAKQLRKLFEQRGVKGQNPIVSSCGTGVTAAIIDTALAEAGFPDGQRMLYDGSWTEWAMRVEPGEGMIVKDG